MSEWVLHCAVNQRHIRRSQPTREAALKDACSQLLEGHAVNRIVGPNENYHRRASEGLVRKALILAQDVVFQTVQRLQFISALSTFPPNPELPL
jgi:hypothetical protein